jgi:hypothetical protein
VQALVAPPSKRFEKQSNTSMAPFLLHLLGTYSALSSVITCNQCSALAPCPPDMLVADNPPSGPFSCQTAATCFGAQSWRVDCCSHFNPSLNQANVPAVNALHRHPVSLDVLITNAKALTVAAFCYHLPAAPSNLQQTNNSTSNDERQHLG